MKENLSIDKLDSNTNSFNFTYYVMRPFGKDVFSNLGNIYRVINQMNRKFNIFNQDEMVEIEKNLEDIRYFLFEKVGMKLCDLIGLDYSSEKDILDEKIVRQNVYRMIEKYME